MIICGRVIVSALMCPVLKIQILLAVKLQLFLNGVNMACYFWFSTSAWSTVQKWLKKYKVSQWFGHNFNSILLITDVCHIKKRLGLQWKTKLRNLAKYLLKLKNWGIFYMLKSISKTRKLFALANWLLKLSPNHKDTL